MLAIVLAVATGMLAPIAAAPIAAAAASATAPAAPIARAASLTLDLELTVDDGGTATAERFSLSATAVDGTAALSGADVDPTSGSALVAAVAPGAYVLSATGPVGYRELGWSCSGGVLDGRTLSIEEGEEVRCVVGQDDVPATLTLESAVDGGQGGEATAADWTLEADGPAVLRGTTGEPAVTAVPVPAGAFSLGATGGPAGYAPTVWSCAGGALDGSTVTVPPGSDAVCTAHHDDLPVDLAVSVDDGGAIVANGGSFGLTVGVVNVGARGVDPHEPVAVTAALPPGATVVEAPTGCVVDGGLAVCFIDPSALAPGASTALAITARFDQAAVAGVHTTLATVSTEDDPAPAQPGCDSASNGVACAATELRFPTITLRQALTSDQGGDASVADFTLTATGPVTVSGASGSPAVSAAAVPAGAYRLAASGPVGYAAGEWACTGGTLDGAALTIVGVVDVTCTIGHDDRAVDLRLDARVEGDAPAGGEVRLSLLVTNGGGRGIDPDEPVTVTHVLPAGLAYLDGPPECSAAGRSVMCGLDPRALPAGGAVALELLLAVAPDAPPGTAESRSSVSTEDDPAPAGGCERPSDNVVCTQVRVIVGIVVAAKSVWEQAHGGWLPSDGVVAFGDRVQFRIVVHADGDAPSTGVVVVDRLPEGLRADGIATCSATCAVELDAATGTHRIDIGTMRPGEAVTVIIAATVPGIPSQADGTEVRVAFDSAASLSSDTVELAATNLVTVRASHALPPGSRSGGDIPIGGIGVALALLVAGGLLLVRSREPAVR